MGGNAKSILNKKYKRLIDKTKDKYAKWNFGESVGVQSVVYLIYPRFRRIDRTAK